MSVFPLLEVDNKAGQKKLNFFEFFLIGFSIMKKIFESLFLSLFHVLHIASTSFRLGFILVTSIIVPMLIFAALSLSISSDADFEAVSMGNRKAALRTAEQIGQHISNSISLLRSVTENVNVLNLNPSQKDIVVKNHVLKFEEFNKVILTDQFGMEVITSEMGGRLQDRSEDIIFKTVAREEIYYSDIFISDNFIPTMTIAIPSYRLGEFDGAIIGKINLINMWRMVDDLTIGKLGYALVVSTRGVLVAHGDGNAKPGIIRNEVLLDYQIVRDVLAGKASILEYINPRGVKVLGAAAPIEGVKWGLIIEQPLSEAYAPTYRMGKRLILLGIIMLLSMSFIAYTGVNVSVINPLRKLVKGIKEKDGSLKSGNEFTNLSKFYNFLSDTMFEMEKSIEKYSKSAGMEQTTAGFIHDLKHPIDNVIRVTRHLLGYVNDDELKKFSGELLDHESKNIKKLILKVREPVVEYLPSAEKISLNNIITDLCKMQETSLKNRNIILKLELTENSLMVNGDRFDLERVLKNLVVNAMEAMNKGGTLTLSTKTEKDRVALSISDTGCGIGSKQIKTLFQVGVSEKNEGWGVGLTVSKELVEKMNGTIQVESKPGKGSTFTLQFKTS